MIYSNRSVKIGDFKESCILMIDDDPTVCELTQLLLAEEGYSNFSYITDPKHAADSLKRLQPDLVLLDLIMPEIDGFQILESLRDNSETKYLPVIVLTAASEADTKIRCLELEATEFLSKPVDRGELLLRVRNTLMVKAYQDQLAYYDPLTGLANRFLFKDRLQWAMEQAETQNSHVALLHLTLDKFRDVNESYGPRFGDRILQVVADRIIDYLKHSDVIRRSGDEDVWRTIARTGGDEFSVLLASNRIDDASYIAAGLVDTINEPFLLDNQDCYLTLSAGISFYPSDASSINELVQHASNAAQYAKQQGGNRYRFYSEEANRLLKENIYLQGQLRKAIKADQFELVFQPQVDSETHVLKGVEALLRWNHPERGYIPPAHFIPLAEDAGLITAIGEWIFKQVCKQAAEWRDQFGVDITVSTNLSSLQLNSPNLIASMKESIADSGVNPESVVIEITESIAMADIENNLLILKQITDLGLALAIDDFGTGYSSLSYIKHMPVSEVKIDKIFVDGIPSDRGDVAIIDAIITMAKELDFRLVAEGIENQTQADYLKEKGCDVLQGFYFYKPISKNAVEEVLVTL